MRRDVYIENDSGGLSVLAADAVDDIIEDSRADDFRFVAAYKALLLELYGDDSMLVRIVVDEPLDAEEEAQWLARASWRIDTSDGRLLVMGGFDPDVLTWWKEQQNEQGDGRGVAAFSAEPGSWRVDVYAHVGSMNGRHILDEARERPGAAFRRTYPGRAFPLWLAHMLDHAGEDDPGFETLWKDVRASMADGKLAVDTEGGDAIGMLVHATRSTESPGEPPEGIWFPLDNERREPATFPLGLPSAVPDRGLAMYRDRLLGRRAPEPERPIADRVVEVIERWAGDPLKAVEGGPVSLPLSELFLLHWMAALSAEATPRFELWVEPKGAWTPPASTADYAAVAKNRTVTAIGPVHNTGGWHTWWTSRSVARLLESVPDGSTIDFAMAPILDEGADDAQAAIGRALYSGTVTGGMLQISDASPRVDHDTLEQAIAFTRDVASESRITVRAPEREAFEAAAARYSIVSGPLLRDGETVRLADPEERMLIMLATPVFRARFGAHWPVPAPEPEDDEE
jgi:hypothetical protein